MDTRSKGIEKASQSLKCLIKQKPLTLSDHFIYLTLGEGILV